MDAAIQKIEETITTFLKQRLSDKLAKEKDDGKRKILRDAYQPWAWLNDAASRVGRIQLVTHVLKYSHPDARGTNLNSTGCRAAGEDLVGTHTLNREVRFDVVSDSGAAFLGKTVSEIRDFLGLKVDGTALWQRARDKDSTLLAALPGDSQENQAWIEAFSSLTATEGPPTSHQLAKQVYWPVNDEGYHLLQPMFPSTLVQRTYTILREVYSETVREARKARRDRKQHSHGYRDWPNRVTQKFGGTKPLNISQLNAERNGEVWLLPAIPPLWRQIGVRPPTRVSSFFNKKSLPQALYQMAYDLGTFLGAVKDKNNIDIRLEAGRRISNIIDELIQHSRSIQLLPAGWSANSECDLPDTERYWLDPWFDDRGFQQQRDSTDWQHDIAERFGNWLNAQLRRRKLPVGDAEFRQWRREFEKELESIIREMANA